MHPGVWGLVRGNAQARGHAVWAGGREEGLEGHREGGREVARTVRQEAGHGAVQAGLSGAVNGRVSSWRKRESKEKASRHWDRKTKERHTWKS